MASERTILAPCRACDPDNSDCSNDLQTAPCCDESCLEIIAQRECHLSCGMEEVSNCNDNKETSTYSGLESPVPRSPQTHKGKRVACSTHFRGVRARYLATIVNLGCVCRELIARNLEPCCMKKNSSSRRGTTAILPKSVPREGLPSKTVAETSCVDFCCCGSEDDDKPSIEQKQLSGVIVQSKGESSTPSCSYNCGDTGTCEATIANKKPGVLPCGCGRSHSDRCAGDASLLSRHSCCGKVLSVPEMLDGQAATQIDLEKGCQLTEHIVLDVQGLTCVGCETKLFRCLESVSGIRNLRTSLVLSQAEFDLEKSAGAVAEVIKSVERSTGFACRRLNNLGQQMEIVVAGNVADFLDRPCPDGVTQVTASGKQSILVNYNPKVIGARALLGHLDGESTRLANPRSSSDVEGGKKHVRKTAWTTLLSACLTVPVLVLAWAPLPPRPLVYGGASLALATIVQLVIAGPFYPTALRALIFTRVIEMDLLIVLSTSTAYVFSLVSFAYQVAGRPLSTGEFFETSTLLVTLIMLGRWASAFARQRAVESVSIRSLQAATAVLCDADGRGDKQIDSRLLQYGDHFKIFPDARVVTDGMVVLGTTEVDESMMTGESLPVEKLTGSYVKAGSLNGSGLVVVRLTQLPGDNTISTIAAMVDEAKFSKPKTQEIVDTVASYFVPVILAITAMTFLIWVAIGISVQHHDAGYAAVHAITYAVAVLIVSCPCAIGLAVPMVVVIAGGVAAKHGVVFKSAMAIETARQVSHVVFDKTGTLTQGELCVSAEVLLSDDPKLAASITLGLTRDSQHPVSLALSKHLKQKGVEAAQITSYKSIPGKGLEGILEGTKVRCGNARWLSAEDSREVQGLLGKGFTVFCVSMDHRVIAAFGLSDSLRPDSRIIVAELQKRDIAVSIISGDDAGAVEAVASQLNIPASHVRSKCTPSDKQDYLKGLMKDKKETVLFCGDGTNDAVALAEAHIGVHLNSGTDVAQNAANVVIMRPSLGGILVLLDLSHAAMRRIFFNFAWSFVYNLFAILLAAGAFVKARIPPQYAGLGEIVSVLPVILIALQLKWFRANY